MGLSNLLIRLPNSADSENKFVNYLDLGLNGLESNMSLIVWDIFGSESPFKDLDENIVVSSFSKVKSSEIYSPEDISWNLAFMVGCTVSMAAVQ